MSMVARTEPGPAEDDITDTDDGDTRISAGAFWPDIVLRELRLAVRLPGRVTTSRLLHTATGAVAHVTRELEAWQQEQQAGGHQTPGHSLSNRASGWWAIRRWPMFRHP